MGDVRHDSRVGLLDRGVTRRSVAGRMLAGGMAAALLAVGVRHDAAAQATPDAAESGPSRYVLTGGDVEIVYVPAAPGGEATLEYRDAKSSLSFAGDQFTVERSQALGGLVSASIDYVADGYDLVVTALIPDVNRDEERSNVPFETFAMMTRHMTSIGGPGLVQGALHRYEVVALVGVAEFAAA